MYPSEHKPHVATFVHKWANQLTDSGCQVRVLTVNAITLGTYLRSWGDVAHFYRHPRRYQYQWQGQIVDVTRFHLGLPVDRSPKAADRAYRAIRPAIEEIRREFPFDLIKIANGEYLALAASRVARDIGVPYITTAIGGHVNVCWKTPDSWKYALEREVFENSRLVVCVSEDMNRKVRHMTDGRSRCLTFYAGVDTAFFRPDPSQRDPFRRRINLDDSHRLLLFLGNLIRTKGIYELLDVFAHLVKKRPELRLLMIGAEVEKKQIAEALTSLGIGPNVSFTGAIPQAEIIGYMNASDIFVFPSWAEGLPNAVTEASACGMPIVATHVGGVPEVVEDGRTGLLVDPKDPVALEAKIDRLLSNPDEARAFALAAREKVESEFNYNRNGRMLAETIQQILAEG